MSIALPCCWEWLWMGRSLIIRDAKTNLIVDYLSDVVRTVRSEK